MITLTYTTDATHTLKFLSGYSLKVKYSRQNMITAIPMSSSILGMDMVGPEVDINLNGVAADGVVEYDGSLVPVSTAYNILNDLVMYENSLVLSLGTPYKTYDNVLISGLELDLLPNDPLAFTYTFDFKYFTEGM